jgi:signal transduction histidine kinase
MGEMIPWLIAIASAVAVAWITSETRRATRWARRTLAGDGAGRRPSGPLMGWLGLEAVLARAEAQSSELAGLRETHERGTGELLAQLTQAVLVIDGQDRLRLANPAGRRLFRLDDKWPGTRFVPMARSADLVEFLRRVRAEGGLGAEIQLNRAPSPDIWIRVVAAPTDAATYGTGAVILVAEDITLLRRLQAVEREFIANASHDLRTPVTILRGYAETLEQDHASMTEAERGRFLGKLVAATQRLGRLLEGLLALASLESGVRLDLREGALAAAAEETVEALGDRLSEAGVEATVEVIDRTGRADPIQARRMAQNLIENALAHARGMTRLCLTVEGGRLEVADDGAGVPESELGRLFDRFYRADRSRRQGGSGIGLSIVRQVAELHGGGARAELAHPRGLRVIVDLSPSTTTTPAGETGVG